MATYFINKENDNLIFINNIIAESGITGDGTEGKPYKIWDKNGFSTFAKSNSYWGSVSSGNYVYVQLEDDIIYDDTANSWAGIGNSSTPFYGSFNGKGHTITFIDGIFTSAESCALFGNIEGKSSDNQQISNLGVNWKNLSVTGWFSADAAGIVMSCKNSRIENCWVSGEMSTSTEADYGADSGSASISGLVGTATNSVIINCYNKANLSASGSGSRGSSSASGIVESLSNSTVENCYNIGNISGGSYGIATTSTNSYYLSGCGASTGGISKTQAELQDINTYYGWDFEDTWIMDPSIEESNGYPYLRAFLKGYTITYNAGNGATGTTYTTDLISSGTITTILSVNDSNLNYTKIGYHFTHWSGDDGNQYDANYEYDKNVNLVLTAQWKANSYTVIFNANTPSGAIPTGASSMDNQAFTYGVSQSLKENDFAYKYYAFKGWATSLNDVVVYDNKESVQNLTAINNGEVNLYAVWEKLTCTTTINITLNVPTNSNSNIIFNVLNGTKDNFTDVQQIVVSGTTTIKLELEKNTQYTIAITKPFSWQIKYNNGEPTTVNYYEFTTSGATQSHAIEISGSAVPNIWVVV